MTISEFRFWLEGFSASFRNGRPNDEQWAEVTRRLTLVEGLRAGPIAPGPDRFSGQIVGSARVGLAQGILNGAQQANNSRVMDALTGRDLGPAD